MYMIIIPVLPEEIERAKTEIVEFDRLKGYDKFICKTNYIGLLGEMVFDRYLTEQGIEHTWIQFTKEGKGFNQPDFIIGGRTVDLKTTFSDTMWFQTPVFDIYIYAQLIDEVLFIRGWMFREDMVAAKSSGLATPVFRDNRVDYTITTEHMFKPVWLEAIYGKAVN
jgi:hypothetical protein